MTKSKEDDGKSRRPPCDDFSKLLESDPHRELQLPGEIGLTVDLSECAARQFVFGDMEIRRIESVERFRPELGLHAFVELEVLENRHVPVLLARTAQLPMVRGVLPNVPCGDNENAAGLM